MVCKPEKARFSVKIETSNPRTGAKVFVPEKFVVTFKPGKEIKNL